MKNSLFLLTFLSLFCVDSYAQVDLKIEVLQVSSIREPTTGKLSLHRYDGPYALITFSITNTSNDEIQLYPSISKMFIKFNYKGIDYTDAVFGLEFLEKGTLTLKPNEKIEQILGSNILLGTPILDEKQKDYTNVMLEVLPTLSLIYKEEKRMLEVKSCKIGRVNVK